MSGLPAEAGICPVHQKPIARECARCGDFGCAVCFERGGTLCARCTSVAPRGPDFSNALSWAWNDPEFGAKLAIGVVCILFAWLFVPMFALLGYQVRIARRIHDDPRAPLPDWSDPIALVWDGFKLWIATILPVLAIELAIVLVAVAIGLLVGLAGAASPSAGGAAAVVAAFGVLGAVIFFIAFTLLYVYLHPAVHLRYVETGSVLCGIDFPRLWREISEKPGRYFELFVYHFAVAFAASFLGQLACLIGIFVTMPWALFTQAYILGIYWSASDADAKKT